MSAPAGWHLQPDGQERYWDGTAWTDHFRAPLASDPTAPPCTAAWAASVDETQALDVDNTQAIPAPGRTASSRPSAAGDRIRLPAAGVPAGRVPAGLPAGELPPAGLSPAGLPQRLPQTGYGAPGTQPYAPPPRQGNAMAKGCLIAAIIGVLVLGRRPSSGASTSSTGPPTRSARPSRRASPPLAADHFPSDLPTEGLGQAIDVTVGDGFDLPRAHHRVGVAAGGRRSGVGIVADHRDEGHAHLGTALPAAVHDVVPRRRW